MVVDEFAVFQTEEVAIDSLTPHPRNYVVHPDDEIDHLMESIQTHGIYHNVTIAKDGTVLAGHGVVTAARRLGLLTIPVRRLDYSPDEPRALQVLIGDNEIAHLAERDDRLLSEILKELHDVDEGLLGTGYDDMMLANLAFVTRPESEIADRAAAAAWVGLPEYDEGGDSPANELRIIVHFLEEADRVRFGELLGVDVTRVANEGRGGSIWWPARKTDDLRSVRFDG